MRVIDFPDGLYILKYANLLAMVHSIGSSTTIHIPGAAKLPCPTPRILLSSFAWYVLADILCLVLILCTVLFSTIVIVFADFLGNPHLLQESCDSGGIILSKHPGASASPLAAFVLSA